MVYPKKLDIRRPRYRHSKTVKFRILAWTLVYNFSSVLGEKKERGAILVTNKYVVHCKCSVWQMEYLGL